MALKTFSVEEFNLVDIYTNNMLATLDRAVGLPTVNAELSKANWHLDMRWLKCHQLYFLAWMDILKCMHELGHVFRCDSGESLTLFMLYMKTEHPEEYLSYDTMDGIIEQYGKIAEELFTVSRPIIDISKDSSFCVADILGRSNFPKIRKSYIFLLYQNSNRISKADSFITKEEELWMSHIMTLHTGIYDQSVPRIKPFNPLMDEKDYPQLLEEIENPSIPEEFDIQVSETSELSDKIEEDGVNSTLSPEIIENPQLDVVEEIEEPQFVQEQPTTIISEDPLVVFFETLRQNGVEPKEKARILASRYIQSMVESGNIPNEGIKDFAINFADIVLVEQANRVSSIDNYSDDMLSVIEADDILIAMTYNDTNSSAEDSVDQDKASEDTTSVEVPNAEPKQKPEGKNVYLKKKNAKAMAVYNKKTGITVLAGSILNDECTASFNVERRNSQMEGNVEIIDGKLTLIHDVHFRTPSGASDFVLGSSSNGWTEWKTRKGNSLDDLFRKKK